ncbi:hypothetical protein C0V70_04245 [Bacteriovorax stolpii]|uniref:Uncharacterized protein n=1 Tax=Bacteriovorax stolpii TaxID=960 RepID=A0A2K9NPA5_BACTC|nr:restriction endonuclease subunit S [Bacteriovorax stolpii]AUN97333.1 hypothetical protein C0V70_04245 [Bacteriovorax stolpii]TDP52505.1 type I restriction enzyme S subunit [Bacteriovorax stolpii]
MSELSIPDSWSELEMTKLCEVQNGQTPKGLPEKLIEGNVPFIKVSDMNSKGNEVEICKTPIQLGVGSIEKFKIKIIDKPSIIFPKNGGALLTNKKRKLLITGAIDTNIMCLIPPIEIYDYFWNWFKTVDFKQFASGSAVPKISLNDIKDIYVPIPPLGEQKRIVKKTELCFEIINSIEVNLNRAEALIEKYRESLLAKAFRGELVPQDPNDEPASELIKSIIVERSKTKNNAKLKETEEETEAEDLDQPFNIPNSWLSLNFADLVYLRARIGWKGLKAEEYTKTGPRFLSVREFKPDGNIDYESSAHISQARFDESPEIMLKENDVLLCKDGSTIGKVTIVKNLKEPTTVNSSIAVMTPFKGVSADYLFYYLKAPLFQTLVQSRIQGAAIPHIFQKDLRALFIPLPPSKEQERIAKKLDVMFEAINSLKNQIEIKRETITKLKEAILFKAFEGRLVEQIPSEGTGHELLERILKEKQSQEANKAKTKTTKTKEPVKKPQTTSISNHREKVVTLMDIIEYFKKNPEGEITSDLLTELGYHSNHDSVEKFYIEIRELINSKKLILRDIQENGLKVGSSYRYRTK